MLRKKVGRRKGRRTKGFFFRNGRGWFTKVRGKFIALVGPDGQRLRDERIEERLLREAAARQLIRPEKVPESAIQDAQVGEACAKYLDHLAAQSDLKTRTGQAKTYIDRGQTLFDFCYGLPGEFFCDGDQKKRAAKGDPEPKRIHAGFGTKLCSELTPAHIDQWLKAHKWSPGGRRIRVQAVKRALNFAVERKVILQNPIRGYKLPKSTSRITYLTPEQQSLMIAAAGSAFGLALKVCIRTGARFGCEFAALSDRHVRDHGDRMEWVFKPAESKTKRQRIVRIADPEIVQLVRERMGHGAIFRNKNGEPWTRRMLSQNFRRARAKVEKQGVRLDADACMYACRHTYAKRTLEGYWTGKPASIKTLARLMGNTVQVCIDHYLQFSEADNEMLWGSA